MKRLIRLFAAAGLAFCLFAFPAEAGEMLVGLIVKTDTNPFFVKMKEAALGKARALGIELRVFSGGYDGDARSQVEAVVAFVRTSRKPENTPGLDFHDTGVALVTDEPVRGVPSISTERALKDCWG